MITIPTIISKLRENYNTNITRSISYRQKQLTGLDRFLKECKSQIIAALFEDLKKPLAEVLSAEIGLVSEELKFTQRNLARWMKPQRVTTSLLAQPGISRIYAEPLGVVLIISPWNYPLQLTLLPLIGALAAGNCVVIKPSEIAPATSRLLASELPKFIDHDCLSIIEGGVTETSELLAEKFDHIFYSGNSNVGRIVMTAAAKNLTPVTLELGGKSPCIIDKNTNLTIAARRIIWSKFSNAGQTCIAPDYILAHESIENTLLTEMKKALHDFYGDNPQTSPDYARMINLTHCQRLIKFLSGNGDIYVGGVSDESDCYISPTILYNVLPDAPVMKEEIFGPLLPVLKIKSIEEAIRFINERPKPLSLYLFSSDTAIQQSIIQQTSSGNISVNYPMLQMTVPALPFGGVGESGMGAYHGKASFSTFSHYKSVLIKPTWFDFNVLYPPYKAGFLRLIRWLM